MPNPVRNVGVIGAGTMGAGIAQAVALSGLKVSLFDADPDALRRGLARAMAQAEEGVRRAKITPEQLDRARSLIGGSPSLAAAVSNADLVIEAAPEVMDLKQGIFAQLGALCPATAILATNTSSLSIARIGSAAPNPSRVIGLHFFNPPHIMKLVEIVRAEATSEDVLGTCRAFVEQLGKEAIVVRDSPGFATSRLGLALGLEAMRMVEQGVASAVDIDRAMELGYGHPMGPLRVSDLVGLDVRLSIAEILHRELDEERFRPPGILRDLVNAGKLGKKTGQGFHRWDK